MEQKTYNKTLKFAIRNEVKAHDFYQEASAKLQDAFLKELFADLAEEENRHKAILEGFQRLAPSVVAFEDNVPDYHVSETVEEVELSTNMKPADAFALAMKKEREAMELYTWMAGASADPRQKELLLGLAVMEKEHKFRMENAFVDIGYPEVW